MLKPRTRRDLEPIWPLVKTDRAAAEAAWHSPGMRRHVWARTSRPGLPGGARLFDGLTDKAATFMAVAILRTEFDAGTLLEAVSYLNGDRQAVADFEQRAPKVAASIADYLELWRAVLDQIGEAIAVRGTDGGAWTPERFSAAHALLRYDGAPYGFDVRDSGLHRAASGQTD